MKKMLALNLTLLMTLSLSGFAQAKMSDERPCKVKKVSTSVKKSVQKKLDKNHYFTTNGIEVILKNSKINNLVGFEIFLKGGSRNLTKENAGIEKLLLNTMTQESKEFPKDKLNNELSKIGANIAINSFFDYSTISLKSIDKYFDRSLYIFQSLINKPLLSEKETELQKGKMETAIKGSIDDPDEYVWKLVNKSFLANHPYANDFSGELDTVKNIKNTDLKNYLAKNIVGSKLMIVVTGNFKEDIKTKIEKYFGKLKKGTYTYVNAPKVITEKSFVNVENRDIPTAYVAGRFAVPTLRDKDYPATYLALKILSSNLHESIRTKRGLSYAVSSGASLRDANAGYVYVTTIKPKECVDLIYQEIDKMKTTLVSKKKLEGAINLYYTQYFIDMEPVIEQATKIGISQVLTGNYNNGYKLLDDFKKVTPEQIKEAMNKYLKNIHFGIIAKKDSINEADFTKM